MENASRLEKVAKMLKSATLADYCNSEKVLFGTMCEGGVPQNNYIGVLYTDGSYNERYTTDWDITFESDPKYIKGEDAISTYFLGGGLRLDNMEEAEFLFQTRYAANDGRTRNKMLLALRGEYELTFENDYFETRGRFEDALSFIEEYKVTLKKKAETLKRRAEKEGKEVEEEARGFGLSQKIDLRCFVKKPRSV